MNGGLASTPPRTLGAVIAGGRSSRFGSDKRRALLAGEALIDHVIGAIAPMVETVVIVGTPWRNLPTVADRPGPGLGPLGGIAGALAHARDHGFERVLTIGCDMPRVPSDLLERLLADSPSVCGDAPILGVWPAALADELVDHLGRGGDRSIRGWARSVAARFVAVSTPLPNVNTPADLLAL